MAQVMFIIQVGKSGSVLGVDSMRAATKLARRNLRRLAAGSRAFADAAGECSFRTHNIFMPAKDFQAKLHFLWAFMPGCLLH